MDDALLTSLSCSGILREQYEKELDAMNLAELLAVFLFIVGFFINPGVTFTIAFFVALGYFGYLAEKARHNANELRSGGEVKDRE